MDELEKILERTKGTIGEEEHRKLELAIETLAYLTSEIGNKRTTIRHLRNLLFGSGSEKTGKVLPDEQEDVGRDSSTGDEDARGDEDTPQGDTEREKKKRKGHGRNGFEKYASAKTVEVEHESLLPGESCPLDPCRGKVYRVRDPRVLLRIVGQPPLAGTVYKLEKYRCNLCLTVFTAKEPEGVGEEKYDATAVSMMAILRYGSGLPLYRLEKLQESLGIPLPSSTQWDVANKFAAIFALACSEMIRQAGQGEVFYNDDTAMKILDLMKADRERRERGEPPGRTGIFTTAIVSLLGDVRIALFFTGRKHAGENLSKVLATREAELATPIQMCDALPRNIPEELKTILCNCMSHARRPYVDIVENFPEECRFVLKTLGEVFRNDAITRKRKMSAKERLEFHRAESLRPMASLRLWMWRELRERRVEPNSGLGQAMAYMRKHWRKLTRFLFVPGAPLDNNLCERILKRAITHRKNSLFYKSERGAWVGDLYMSLIATCELAGANSFDYLTALQRHQGELAENPSEWMPWNYKAALKRLSRASPSENPAP